MKPAAKYGIAAAVVIVLLAAAGAFWFLRDDAPDEVDLDDRRRLGRGQHHDHRSR